MHFVICTPLRTSLRCLLVLALLLQATHAFLTFDSTILGGVASIAAYGIGTLVLGPAAPIAAMVTFVGSAYKVEQWKKDSHEYALQVRSEEWKVENLQWHDCGQLPRIRTTTVCSSSKYGNCRNLLQMHGESGCNSCGADALVTRRWRHPQWAYNTEREQLCKSTVTGEIFKPHYDTTQPQFWNCTRLPSYSECKACGPGTDTAGYARDVTGAGVLLTCRRQDGTEDNKFVTTF
jgi:hypothetical protein